MNALKMSVWAIFVGSVFSLPSNTTFAQSASEVRIETRAADAQDLLGVTGDGVIIAILDRGIDYEHPDFLNVDGTSRILYILDLTDDTGAGDADNSAGVGTVYTKDEIDNALTSGQRLATRDAVGHGTTTAGLAGGNGRASNGLYAGMAPNAYFIIVKFTTEGAAAHGDESAEDPFYQPALFPTALDFIIDKAEDENMPFVVLANFGSIGAISDGTTFLASAIDDRFGAGKSGRVFVSGTSDDGGQQNHAAGEIAMGQTAELLIRKGNPGNLRLQLWYTSTDRFDVEIETPSGQAGPFISPADNGDRDNQQDADFWYFHNGSEVDFADAFSKTREILIDFSGPVGDYVVRLTGTTVSANGSFNAWLNPSTIFSGSENRFESFVVPGHTIWEMAAAENNIAPNSYVLRTEWTDVDGVQHAVTDEGNVGELWVGSGIGPTVDGRFGVTVSAPGERLFAPYGPRSVFATTRSNVVLDDGNGGLYGIQSAVSAAAPITTGIIALMLEADPSLDAGQVKDILQQTARQDAFTGTVPNNAWGYGKIDALAAVAMAMGSGVSNESTAQAIDRHALEQNYPNPFSSSTAIPFNLAVASPISLHIYDLLGRKVDTVWSGALPAGFHEITFEANNLPGGVYFYRLETGVSQEVRMMTYIP